MIINYFHYIWDYEIFCHYGNENEIFYFIYYYYYVGITVMKLLNWGSDVLKYYYNIVTIQNIYQQHLLNAN